jgi:hypothetical protein
MRKTLPLENFQKKKISLNLAIRRNSFRFWLKGIGRWDSRLTQSNTKFRKSPDWDIKIAKLYSFLLLVFG